MAEETGGIGWFQPRRRAVFPIEGIAVSRSLRKELTRQRFRITFDDAFVAVVQACRRPEGTWINDEIVRAFVQVHHEGWGHSCECWDGEELVGGVYGIAIGACFCAESMFHTRTNASKVALWALVEECRRLGFELFDAQIMTPHLASLGALEVTHDEYLRRLQDATRRSTSWSLPVG